MSEERRFQERAHWQLLFAVVVFCMAAVWFSWQVLWPSATTLTHGFGAYYSASRLLSNGDLSADIYDPAYFQPIVQQDSQGQVSDIFNANPPTTTLMFWPLAFLPIQQARLLWTFANVVFLTAGLGILLQGFGLSFRDRAQWPILLLVLTFGLLFHPVAQNFRFGQAYVLTFFLLSITTAVCIKTQPINQLPNYPITQSIGALALTLALLLKTAGWPLLILLFWLRKARLLAWIIGSGIIIFLATLPVFPLQMWLAYLRLLSQVNRSPLICVAAYQTTRSWLCHLFAPNVFWQEAETAGNAIPVPVTIVYAILGIACLLALLWLARKRPHVAFIGFVCWSVLFLPLGEVHHHTVMFIPFAWFIVRWSAHSRVSRMMVGLAAVCYLISFPINAPQFQTGWLSLFAYPYLAGAWLIFLGILWDCKSEMFPARG